MCLATFECERVLSFEVNALALRALPPFFFPVFDLGFSSIKVTCCFMNRCPAFTIVLPKVSPATRRQKKRGANSARLNIVPLQALEDGFKNRSPDELEIPRFMKAVQWPAASKSCLAILKVLSRL